ncbi:MAG: reverse transcriptase family protein [Oscillospiraceae bacterium]
MIIPKFKKGNASDPANYRPIALTCAICKILESIITSELLSFLLSHNLLSKSQHGFLKRHSTSTNLLETLNDWTISVSNHKSVIAAYIDFSRAFDVLSHSKIMHKLVSYGVTGNLLFWIQAFLSYRFQQVRINQSLSSPLPVLSGVPQGSVLGPLLFLIYINDIADTFSSSVTVKLFADDIKMYTDFSMPTIGTNFQSHLNKILDWTILWQINISYSKCTIFNLGTKDFTTTLSLSDHNLSSSASVKDLGVLFDSALSFNGHINEIVSRANQRASLIIRSFLSRNTQSYQSLHSICSATSRIYLNGLVTFTYLSN